MPRIDQPGLLALIRAAHDSFPKSWTLRAKWLAKAVRHRSAVRILFAQPPGSALARALDERPELRGILLWPYQINSWSLGERLDRFCAHYVEVDRLGAAWAMGIDDKRVLFDLHDIHEGLTVILDQPYWFMREGGFTLNLFTGDFRAFSIAFSLFRDDRDRVCALIGGVQGRNTEDALALYRQLTKAAHGLRPRDLLLEALRMLLRHWQVAALFGVSENARHHRHPFFGTKPQEPGQNYDTIWEDRGGARISEVEWALPLNAERRDLEDIAAKKRSLYRKRYAFLDALAAEAEAGFPAGRTLQFEAG